MSEPREAYIVTGDSGGLGSAIARAIVRNVDGIVVGISRSTNDTVLGLEEKLRDRFVHMAIDLADLQNLESTFKSGIYDRYRIKGLVNNSATAYDDLATNLRIGPLHEMFSVNVYAAMVLSKMAIRNMLLHESSGSIVHISSVSVHTGYKGLSMYAATKGAIEAYSKNLAREWGPRGIRSNCVAAGFMDTPMTSTLRDDQKSRIFQRNSMKTMMTTTEVAESVAFLVTDRSSGITGTTVHVDKGTL